jgi:hypothetical protein
VFSDVHWYRSAPESRYPWLSARRYKLDTIRIRLSDLEEIFGKVDEISFESYSLVRDQRDQGRLMSVLSSLNLVECNPYVKQLQLMASDNMGSYQFNCRLMNYLNQRCPAVNEALLYPASAENIHRR